MENRFMEQQVENRYDFINQLKTWSSIALGAFSAVGISYSFYHMVTLFLTGERMWFFAFIVYFALFSLALSTLIFACFAIYHFLPVNNPNIVILIWFLLAVVFFICYYYFYDHRLYWWVQCADEYWVCMDNEAM